MKYYSRTYADMLIATHRGLEDQEINHGYYSEPCLKTMYNKEGLEFMRSYINTNRVVTSPSGEKFLQSIGLKADEVMIRKINGISLRIFFEDRSIKPIIRNKVFIWSAGRTLKIIYKDGNREEFHGVETILLKEETWYNLNLNDQRHAIQEDTNNSVTSLGS
jgi:hypothetical protein